MLFQDDIKNKENIEKLYSFLSTGTYKPFRLSSILESSESWINPCNPKFIQLLKLPRTIEYTHNSEALTTVSKKIYGTTSLWYLILACSKYLHQDEIPNREIILLPDITSITTIIQEQVESRVGKTIII